MMVRYFLIIYFLLQCCTINCAYAKDHYHAGKALFKAGKYNLANNEFKDALKIAPKNVNYLYYYAQTLIYLKQLDKAQTVYENIISLDPTSEAAKLSIKGISAIHEHNLFLQNKSLSSSKTLASIDIPGNIKNISQSKIKNSYIKNAANDQGLIIRWNNNAMPIKVYYQEAGNPSYKSSVENAFNTWSSSLAGLLSFKTVTNKQDANILISFKQKLDNSKNNDKFIAGLTKPFFKEYSLEYVTIRFTTEKPDGEPISTTALYNTSLHEIGHAIGIWGHSNDKNDIMHAIAHDKSEKIMRKLSERDINTATILYNLDHGKLNTDNNTSKNIVGNVDSRLENKLNEALGYVKKAPNSPISWRQVGDVYKSMEKYNEAIENYEKSLSLDPNFTESREGLAYAYTEKKQYMNAIKEYKTLITSKPSKIVYSYNLAVIYIDTNKKANAKQVINALIRNNPKANENEKIKNVMKILNIN